MDVTARKSPGLISASLIGWLKMISVLSVTAMSTALPSASLTESDLPSKVEIAPRTWTGCCACAAAIVKPSAIEHNVVASCFMRPPDESFEPALLASCLLRRLDAVLADLDARGRVHFAARFDV